MRLLLLAVFACLLRAEPPDVRNWTSVLEEANGMVTQGRYDGAIQALRSAIARGSGGDSLGSAMAYNNLGAIYHDLGRCEEGKTAHRRALGLYEKSGNAGAVVDGALNFASLLVDCGAPEEATRLIRRVLEPRSGQFTPLQHARTRVLEANALLHDGQYAAAEPVFRESLSRLEGKEAGLRAVAHNGLAVTLARMERDDEAIEELRRGIGLLEHASGATVAFRAKMLANIGMLYKRKRRYGDAETSYRAAIEAAEAALGGDHPMAGRILLDYSELLRACGRRDEARQAKRRADAILAGAWMPATVDIAELSAAGRRGGL